MKFYVYVRNVRTRKEDFCGVYYSWEEAIERVTALYNMDKNSIEKGKNYYFIVDRMN